MSNEFMICGQEFKDLLNEQIELQRTELSKLLYPYGRTAYVEQLDALIEHLGNAEGGINRTPLPFWVNRVV